MAVTARVSYHTEWLQDTSPGTTLSAYLFATTRGAFEAAQRYSRTDALQALLPAGRCAVQVLPCVEPPDFAARPEAQNMTSLLTLVKAEDGDLLLVTRNPDAAAFDDRKAGPEESLLRAFCPPSEPLPLRPHYLAACFAATLAMGVQFLYAAELRDVSVDALVEFVLRRFISLSLPYSDPAAYGGASGQSLALQALAMEALKPLSRVECAVLLGRLTESPASADFPWVPTHASHGILPHETLRTSAVCALARVLHNIEENSAVLASPSGNRFLWMRSYQPAILHALRLAAFSRVSDLWL